MAAYTFGVVLIIIAHVLAILGLVLAVLGKNIKYPQGLFASIAGIVAGLTILVPRIVGIIYVIYILFNM